MANFELALLKPDAEAELFPVKSEGCYIGRSQSMDITIDGSTVSRRHVRLWEEDGQIHIEDLSSRNGISINGDRSHDSRLKGGDHLSVGQNYFYVHDTSQPRPAVWPTPINGSPITKPAAPSGNNGDRSRGNEMRKPIARTEESDWLPLLLEPETLQKNLAKAALDSIAATRVFLLTGGSGVKTFRILAAHSANNNPDGPTMNSVLIDRVLRTKRPLATEVVAATDTPVLCAPLIGYDGCVGVVYVDGGMNGIAPNATDLDKLEAFGRKAGRLLQMAAKLRGAMEEKRRQGVRESAQASARSASRIVSSVAGAAALLEKAATGDASDIARARLAFKHSADQLQALQANAAALTYASLPADSMPFDVGPVTEAVVNELTPRAEGKHITLEYRAQGHTLAYADDQDVTHAVSNLVGNAIDACETGGSVKVQASNEADGCHIQISDTGPGFVDGSEPDLKTGRGLLERGTGLAATYALVKRHGGEIRLRKGNRCGATFTIVLPQRDRS